MKRAFNVLARAARCGRGVALALCVAIALAAATATLAAPATDVMRVGDYPVTINFAEGDERVANRVAEICIDVIPGLAGEIGQGTVEPFRILLIRDMPGFQREQGIRLPPWGVAFALMDNQIMLVDVARATTAWNSLERVIPHELSHLLLAQRIGDVRLPVWFVEGLAVWQAREWSLFDNWRLMEAVWTNRAPELWHITASLPAEEANVRNAYRVAYSALVERFDGDMARLPRFLDEVVLTGDFSQGFEAYFGERDVDYYMRFAQALDHKYKSRLLLFQVGPLFSIVAVLFLFVLLRVQLRNRRKLKRMEEADRGLWLDGH